MHRILNGLLGSVGLAVHYEATCRYMPDGPQFESEPFSCQSAMVVRYGSKKRTTREKKEEAR
jgi:hypothetical protein